MPQRRSLLITLWEKEKMLETRIFYLSNNAFYPMKDKFNVFRNIEFVAADPFNLDRAEILWSA